VAVSGVASSFDRFQQRVALFDTIRSKLKWGFGWNASCTSTGLFGSWMSIFGVPVRKLEHVRPVERLGLSSVCWSADGQSFAVVATADAAPTFATSSRVAAVDTGIQLFKPDGNRNSVTRVAVRDLVGRSHPPLRDRHHDTWQTLAACAVQPHFAPTHRSSHIVHSLFSHCAFHPSPTQLLLRPYAWPFRLEK
jgi:hypothetical protein